MTARRLYTEDQIVAALHEASRKHGILPATGTFLKELRGKGEPVLFGKEDLLAAAKTQYERMVVHGVFAILGTDMANDIALTQTVRESSVGLVMKMLMDLVKE